MNKGTGLSASLDELGSRRITRSVLAMQKTIMRFWDCASAALPALKDRADWVTAHSHGGGVEEVIQLLLQNDLEDLASRLKRHLLGNADTGEPILLARLLIASFSWVFWFWYDRWQCRW